MGFASSLGGDADDSDYENSNPFVPYVPKRVPRGGGPVDPYDTGDDDDRYGF